MDYLQNQPVAVLHHPYGGDPQLYPLFWYPMRVTYGRELIVKQRLDQLSIENFLPMRYALVEHREGIRRRELVPAVSNLVFVRSTKSDLVRLKRTERDLLPLRFMVHHFLEEDLPPEVLTVPDRQMQNFLQVATVTDDRIQFLDNPDLVARPGTYIRVIDGPFGGVKGFVRRVAKNRRIIVQLKGVLSVALSCVSASDIMPISEEEYNEM